MLEPLPDSFPSTRAALHTLAEHVIAPARHAIDGHIGLVPTPGGIGTPTLGDGERIRVDGVELVHERPGATTRVGITNVAAAAQFLGIKPGMPADIYKAATPCRPDAPLGIDAAGAKALADWYEFGATLFDDLRSTYTGHNPSSPTIWPEHFDLALELGDAGAGTRANYGASPGDDAIGEPYLYVGPWDESRRTGRFGDHAFGAAITYAELLGAVDARSAGREFVFEGAALLLGQP